MGQHKYNPNVQKAKNGELPPKPKKKGKKQIEQEMMRMMQYKLYEKTGLNISNFYK